MNAFEVENSLMDHHYFGIRNILALRGDPPDGEKDWKPKEGGYQYAYQLIRQIKNLNAGEFLTRTAGDAGTLSGVKREGTKFCIGAAAYPEHPDPRERAEFFRLKVEAGAEYGITDMLFDGDRYSEFLELIARAGASVPILPGTRILKSQAQARRMMSKFRVSVPSSILSRLPEEELPKGASPAAREEVLKRGIEVFQGLVEQLKAAGAPGIHVFVIADTQAAARAIQALK
jgi:methylenetetrahydrofolate reductase (NADPH)